MTPQLESHLMEMGILPPTDMDALEQVDDPRLIYLAKGYYNDPRDENGEVNF